MQPLYQIHEHQEHSAMHIRPACESDLADLANLYRETVLAIAPQQYTPAQTQAWAASAVDGVSFRQFILGPTTYVAVDDTGIVGFAGIEATGHVTSTYVRGDRIRQGIGSALMEVVLAHACQHHLPRLYAEASEFSLGLFKKFGFRLYDTEEVDRGGVKFTRYLVERLT
ncbi:MAG: GNAT family N-acetyltransferase [Synechococcales bacterium]|nr:GNAT family N-acetyltransferase [Synechococcales bacterium]